MDTEIWKTIPDYPDYEASTYGRVRSHKNSEPRILIQSILKNGYKSLALCKLGKPITKRVNRLVLETFKGQCPEGMECSHLDGDRLNNHLNNMTWETRGDNNRRKESTKLNYLKASWIRILIKRGWSERALAKRFDVSRGTICAIKRNEIWKDR